VAKAVKENFGTPNHLIVWDKFPIDFGTADEAAGHEAGWKLKEGRNLYMIHCVHCHGTSGDGNGPTAKFLFPRPRDFRPGVFKFTSTLTGLKPTRSDLMRTLDEGIPGTYMPSFVLLGEDKLGAIIEYVRFLATRGEFESRLATEFAGLGPAKRKDFDREVADQRKQGGKSSKEILEDLKKAIADELAALTDQVATDVAETWTKIESEDAVVMPKVARTEPTATTTVPVEGKQNLTSIQNGRELFLSKKAKCSDCHGAAGRGDGPLTEDFWDIPNTTPAEKYPRRGLHDMWGHPQQPRDLTRGQYRGGRRPLDLYRRIFAGIKGTQMPAFGGTVLKDEEIWDIVNYVTSLPFEPKSAAAQPDHTAHVHKKEDVASK
jgi:mono/diheme cytochrome c family protein